ADADGVHRQRLRRPPGVVTSRQRIAAGEARDATVQARVASRARPGALGASASDYLAACAAHAVAAIGDYEAAACSTDHGVVAATIADVDKIIAAPAAPGPYQRRAAGIDQRVGA